MYRTVWIGTYTSGGFGGVAVIVRVPKVVDCREVLVDGGAFRDSFAAIAAAFPGKEIFPQRLHFCQQMRFAAKAGFVAVEKGVVQLDDAWQGISRQGGGKCGVG